jgi:hypothetical protein
VRAQQQDCDDKETWGDDDVLTSIKGQTGLPRYFAAVSKSRARRHLNRGRLDFVLPDGRRFPRRRARPARWPRS